MTPSEAEKLKQYRKKKANEYAKVILSKPVKTRLKSVIRFPGVIMIMGDVRTGKSGLAHEIANQMHTSHDMPAALHLPKVGENQKKRINKLIPSWMQITANRRDWPQNGVIIYDEAAQSAHSRRSQSGDAVELDDLLSISGQRQQLIVFISHYSRKLDLNICAAVHRLIWKRPTYAHTMWERDEMADFTMKAFDFFQAIKGDTAKKRAALVLDMDNFHFFHVDNKLAPWWTDELSRLFKDIELNGVSHNGRASGY